MIRTCLTCKRTFQSDENIYCSKKCCPDKTDLTGAPTRTKSKTQKRRTCETCLASFTPPSHGPDYVYCSRTCTPKGRNRNGNLRAPPHTCYDNTEYRDKQSKAWKEYWKRWREENPRPRRPSGAFPDNWSSIRKTIIGRDEGTCLVCHQQMDEVTVHFIDEDRTHVSPNNLVTVCTQCHESKVHRMPPTKLKVSERTKQWLKNRDRWRRYFESVMSNESMREKNSSLRL